MSFMKSEGSCNAARGPIAGEGGPWGYKAGTATEIERFAALTHSLMQMAYQTQEAGFHGDSDSGSQTGFVPERNGEERDQNGTPYGSYRQTRREFATISPRQ